MALKTFNLDLEVYKKFSEHCKKQGISMSKKIENFLRKELEQIENSKSKITLPNKNNLALLNNTKKPKKEHYMTRYC